MEARMQKVICAMERSTHLIIRVEEALKATGYIWEHLTGLHEQERGPSGLTLPREGKAKSSLRAFAVPHKWENQHTYTKTLLKREEGKAGRQGGSIRLEVWS